LAGDLLLQVLRLVHDEIVVGRDDAPADGYVR
jgi:hypothetical protein